MSCWEKLKGFSNIYIYVAFKNDISSEFLWRLIFWNIQIPWWRYLTKSIFRTYSFKMFWGALLPMIYSISIPRFNLFKCLMKLFSGRLQQPVENGSMSSSPIMVGQSIVMAKNHNNQHNHDNCMTNFGPKVITHITNTTWKLYLPITFTFISFCSMFRQKKVQLKALRALHRRTSQEEHQKIVDNLKCVEFNIWSLIT